MGRKKQAPKKEHHSTLIKKDKYKRRFKRKTPTATKHVSAAKRALKKSSATATANHQRQGVASSKNSLRSGDEFYLFKNVWAHLKGDGWKWEKTRRNTLSNWYYVRPGKDHKTGIPGTDYFSSEEQVLEWAKSVNYRKQVGVETTDDSSADEEGCEEQSWISAEEEEEDKQSCIIGTDVEDETSAKVDCDEQSCINGTDADAEQCCINGTDADVSNAEETIGAADTDHPEDR